MKTKLRHTRWLVLATFLLVGLQEANAWYSPSQQRWLNRDPIQERGGFNIYRYADNDPLWRVDPWGLDVGGRVGPGYPNDGYPHPPPLYDPGKWGNENCLAYALDRCGRGRGEVYPGGGSNVDSNDCKSLMNQLKSKFRMGEPTNGKCDPGYHKIKVYAGFHIQRQDGDGTWSEKELGFPVRKCRTDAAGNPIDSPQTGQKPAKYCGELCVPD